MVLRNTFAIVGDAVEGTRSATVIFPCKILEKYFKIEKNMRQRLDRDSPIKSK